MKSLGLSLLIISGVALACSSEGAQTSDEQKNGSGGADAPTETNTGGTAEPSPSGGSGATTTGGRSMGGAAGGESATGSGGADRDAPPMSTVVDGISFEAIACGAAIDGATQVVLSPDVANFGGWSHLHNGTFAGNGLDASGLLSSDLSVYDISDTSRVGEPDCGGDDTWRRTLVRRVEGHTNKHANGLQVRGTHPDLLGAESLIIDLRLEVDGTNIPTGIDAIHDGTAVLQVVADGDEVRIPISPELYLGHWIRITIPADRLGTGVPSRLQFVAELSTGGIDDSRNDFEELDLNIYQIAYTLKP